jgi:hypothetical protein
MTRAPSVAVRFWLATTVLGLAPAAHAYLDPSTGSMILSAVVGIFATISLALKTYWYKLKSLFRGSPQSPSVKPAGDGPGNEGRSSPAGRP